MKEGYHVLPVPSEQCRPWLLEKHYARRLPPIVYAFGLYKKQELVGVCTFGIPASRFEFNPYELNRLVIGEQHHCLSYFVAQCLSQFPEKPMVIVSYADSSVGHHGYIYQATNWIYTGLIEVRPEIIIDGQTLHCRTVYDKYGYCGMKELKENGINAELAESKAKHRYFYILGSKKQKKELLATIKSKYEVFPYPKGDNTRYDTGKTLPTQGLLC